MPSKRTPRSWHLSNLCNNSIGRNLAVPNPQLPSRPSSKMINSGLYHSSIHHAPEKTLSAYHVTEPRFLALCFQRIDDMKVAYFSADLGVPIFGQKGCSIHAQEILSAFLRRGAEVKLFSTNTDGVTPLALCGIEIFALPRPGKCDIAEREQKCLALNHKWRLALEQQGPFDLVYERYSLWSFAALEYARDKHTPGLLEVNAPLIEEQAEHRILVDRAGAERAAKKAFSNASALLAVSDEIANYLKGFPIGQNRIHVVPNGVDPERFPANCPPAILFPGKFVIGFVGTLKPWHGLSVLVEAFAVLRKEIPNAQLLIVGDGPEREKITDDLITRGLTESVHFTGAVPAEEIPGLLASMNVVVAPYPKLEHFYFSPLKVYEYMAAGLPIVASKIGQIERIIEHDINGLLVTPGDANALADALLKLGSELEICRRVGQAARQSAQCHHTWDSVLDHVLKIAGLGNSQTHEP